ncbi:P-loop NTPase fold protein [Flagellimonas halotolerans]|uniref:P-loop NTPase fold protein n=1 Tax=Flagellimonas halotolerans TaxID=3112164 RepID=A0ABU6IU83_9FLAO|nr:MULTISPECIES: P-loop NTPase fold protein [unclassified Allomuricauda]MEC3966791.1 P-loop NTPase fold protein [Muricauda sp. SYSU M86414]MEC4266693.1 P-loop NTPase fold protein [Muricauda sp. SYSU M84420]
MKIDPLKVPFDDFEKHINIEGNHRILFSGIYGTGKTWFLDKFFEVKNDKYASIHIKPVNYAIGSNKDIFELIKVDILFEILNRNEITFDEIELDNKLLAEYLILDRLGIIFPTLIEGLSDVTAAHEGLEDENFLVKGITNLLKVVNKLKPGTEYKSKLKENPDLTLIKENFAGHTDVIGGLYERNATTQLIQELVQVISKNETQEREEDKSNKETVLVIDDLDRLDPNDIFRILNIFSAHFDIESPQENKFGFDRVVLVCDVENLESIYRHKYGEQTDFNGYINKFYSNRIYNYDNRENINQITQAFIEQFDRRYLWPKFKQLMHQLIRIGINSKHLSLRRLLQFDINSIKPLDKQLTLRDFSTWHTNQFPPLQVYYLLENIFEGRQRVMDFMEYIRFIENDEFPDQKQSDMLKMLIPLIDLNRIVEEGKNLRGEQHSRGFSLKDLNVHINYTLAINQYWSAKDLTISSNGSVDVNYYPNLNNFLGYTYKSILEKKLLD